MATEENLSLALKDSCGPSLQSYKHMCMPDRAEMVYMWGPSKKQLRCGYWAPIGYTSLFSGTLGRNIFTNKLFFGETS